MMFKKIGLNASSLRHYAGTNIIVVLAKVAGAGFVYGAIVAIALQILVEFNQATGSSLGLREYLKTKWKDTLWDTLFAIAGILVILL